SREIARHLRASVLDLVDSEGVPAAVATTGHRDERSDQTDDRRGGRENNEPRDFVKSEHEDHEQARVGTYEQQRASEHRPLLGARTEGCLPGRLAGAYRRAVSDGRAGSWLLRSSTSSGTRSTDSNRVA